jgi:homoserine/homoserine lactone efflux protein
LSALGLGTVLLAAPELFGVARYLGIAYLIYLGALRCLRHRTPEQIPRELAAQPAFALFRQSLLLQLANPKSLLFFGSMLPGFIGSTSHAGLRILTLGVLAVVLEFPVLFVYSVLGARISGFVTHPRGNIWLDRVSGGLMIGAALFVLSVSGAP